MGGNHLVAAMNSKEVFFSVFFPTHLNMISKKPSKRKRGCSGRKAEKKENKNVRVSQV